MKFIFASDLHGSRALYHALEKLIAAETPDFLLFGGDLFAYSPHAEPQLSFIEEYLSGFFKRIGIPAYDVPGNCDKPLSADCLHQRGLLQLLTLEGTVIHSVPFIGYGYTSPNPFRVKDRERRDLKADNITFEKTCLVSDADDQLQAVPGDFLNGLPSIEEDLNILKDKNAIWVMHAPPAGGVLDQTNAHICCGSKAIRRAIERVQPILTLHGHIHEAPMMSHSWYEKIGSTISINPGSGERLHAVVVKMDKDKNTVSAKHTLYGQPTC